MKPKLLTDDEIQSTVRIAIQEAVSYVDDNIAPDRLTATQYFEGKVDITAPEGRSSVVSTKVRDAVRAAKPAIMRIFFQSDKPVEFAPVRPDDVDGAQQATNYVRAKVAQCGGYRLRNDAIQDALVKKTGILKVYYENSEEVEFEDYTGISEEQLAFLASDDDVEIIEATGEEADTEFGLLIKYDVKISYTKEDGDIKIESVPPEEFFVDSRARGPHDYYIIGHSTSKRVGDLVAMGFDFEEVATLTGDNDYGTSRDSERQNRTGYSYDDDAEQGSIDPSMRNVLVTECYMKMDIEGTGIPTLYQFICGGSDYKVLSKEKAEEDPFAVYEVDPEPHTFFGRALADLIIKDQDAATYLLRGLLDNIGLSNTPQRIGIEGLVNFEDLMDFEIGKIVRAKGPGAVEELNVPFMAGATLPAIQYFDEVINAKTGINAASMGLDPDALQSTTAAGVNAAVQAAAGQMEVIARNLAETGEQQLYGKIMRLAKRHVQQEEMIRLDGQFVPVDPRTWNAHMDLETNVGLGTGARDERIMALEETNQKQMAIWQAYGPGNGLVTMTGIRNALADKNKLLGVHNSDRYWESMTPEREQELIAKAAQQQQPQTDPNAAFLEAEKMKAEAKVQSDQINAQIKAQSEIAKDAREREKAAREDDLARDRMAQDLITDAAELQGKFGTQVDIARIKAEQAVPRE